MRQNNINISKCNRKKSRKNLKEHKQYSTKSQCHQCSENGKNVLTKIAENCTVMFHIIAI